LDDALEMATASGHDFPASPMRSILLNVFRQVRHRDMCAVAPFASSSASSEKKMNVNKNQVLLGYEVLV
jgi:hypothetical protein